jgi:hypothetical protein
MGEACPIRQSQRRLPLAKQADAGKMLKDKQRRGVIKESDSTVILIRKKNGDLHFCIDYKKLNDVTRKDYFLLPQTDDTLDMPAGAK